MAPECLGLRARYDSARVATAYGTRLRLRRHCVHKAYTYTAGSQRLLLFTYLNIYTFTYLHIPEHPHPVQY